MSTFWQDYQDKYRLALNTRGKCRCVEDSMRTSLRLRLNRETVTSAWFVATHMPLTPDRVTLLRYDAQGLQWQVTDVPGTNGCMVRLIGVAPGMVSALDHTRFLSQILNEEDL